jgi:hypothetical protein
MTHLESCRRELADIVEMPGLIAVADRFVKGLGVAGRGAVPAAFRPRAIASREDLRHWASRLEACTAMGTAQSGARGFLHEAMERANEIGPRRAAQ